MGVKDEQINAKRNKKRQRFAVPEHRVNMSDLDLPTLYDALESILKAGGALRIGCTRDYGAWAFGVYGDGAQPYTEYVRASEDVNAYLKALGEFFAAL